jgi:hypothetical protein
MRSAFERWNWVANEALFTLKRIYQRWLYPWILVGGLGYPFAAGHLGSLILAMVYHSIGNLLYKIIYLPLAVIGVG